MAPETMGTDIENAAELRDFIDMDMVMEDAAEGTDFDTAVRAQMKTQGIDASDEVIAELVAELEESTEEVTV